LSESDFAIVEKQVEEFFEEFFNEWQTRQG
jgi:hypothetical protein